MKKTKVNTANLDDEKTPDLSAPESPGQDEQDETAEQAAPEEQAAPDAPEQAPSLLEQLRAKIAEAPTEQPTDPDAIEMERAARHATLPSAIELPGVPVTAAERVAAQDDDAATQIATHGHVYK